MKIKHLLVLPLLLLSFDLLAAVEYDTKPQPLRTPPPEYGPDLRKDNVEGIVVLNLSIDEAGKVFEVVVSKSSNSRLDSSALKAVKKWRFKPATKDGVAVAATLVVPIQFRLDE